SPAFVDRIGALVRGSPPRERRREARLVQGLALSRVCEAGARKSWPCRAESIIRFPWTTPATFPHSREGDPPQGGTPTPAGHGPSWSPALRRSPDQRMA